MPDISKKLRIQLYDKDFNQISDRLVEQDIEFAKGPKSSHNGPLRLDACLYTQEDTNLYIAYLNRLTGLLPLETTKPKKLKALNSEEDTEGFREDIVKQLQVVKTQEEAIKLLRSLNFVFMTYEELQDREYVSQIIPGTPGHGFMIRMVKESKNPLTHKYDPILKVAFNIGKAKEDYFYIWLFDEMLKVKVPWKDEEKMTFKKTEMSKFPPFMILEEREKFRTELYLLRKDEEREPSKFFLRWMREVTFKEQKAWLEKFNK